MYYGCVCTAKVKGLVRYQVGQDLGPPSSLPPGRQGMKKTSLWGWATSLKNLKNGGKRSSIHSPSPHIHSHFTPFPLCPFSGGSERRVSVFCLATLNGRVTFYRPFCTLLFVTQTPRMLEPKEISGTVWISPTPEFYYLRSEQFPNGNMNPRAFD